MTLYALWIIAMVQCCSAETGRVKALLIGNDAYSQSEMFPQLRGTPQRDVNAVAGALRAAGVAKKDITSLTNLDYKDFFDAVHAFRLELNESDSAIFYYSGHGFSLDEAAFLVPTDFKLGRTKRVNESRSVSLDQVKRELSKAKMRAFVIDACRTNIPLLKQALGPKTPLSLANLYDSKLAGTGELIVFATQGGEPANAEAPADGLSYFTYFFANRLKSAPLDMGTVALQAQIATSTASEHSQEPDVRNNLQGYLFFPSFNPASTSPYPTPITQSPRPVETDYRTTLPLICPPQGRFTASWQLSEPIVASPAYVYGGPSPTFQTMLGSAGSIVNPILLGRMGVPEIRLSGGMESRYRALIQEIQSTTDPPKDLSGPKGPIALKRQFISVAREIHSDFLYVTYTDLLGSQSVSKGTLQHRINDLTGEAQTFISTLDHLSVEQMSKACEAALQQLSPSTP